MSIHAHLADVANPPAQPLARVTRRGLGRTLARTLARHVPTAVRILLGLLWTVVGANYWLELLAPPAEPPPAEAMAFAGALFQTGYMFPLIKGTEVAVGLLLLANRLVPLALVVIAPVIVNIVAFHVVLAPDSLVLPFAIVAATGYLAWTRRAAYRPLLSWRTVTTG